MRTRLLVSKRTEAMPWSNQKLVRESQNSAQKVLSISLKLQTTRVICDGQFCFSKDFCWSVSNLLEVYIPLSYSAFIYIYILLIYTLCICKYVFCIYIYVLYIYIYIYLYLSIYLHTYIYIYMYIYIYIYIKYVLTYI